MTLHSSLQKPNVMLRAAVCLVLAAIAATCISALFPSGAAAASSPTVVSLEFDDGTAGQYATRQVLADHGMHATYFINSGRLGLSSSYMTVQQATGLQTDGNEIAGHTINHPDLLTLNADEQKRQICNDRSSLLSKGFDVQNFAYPFSSFDATTKQAVADCGYNSGRAVGGVRSASSCSGCPFAESLTPPDLYATATPNSVKTGDTLATLQGYVTGAREHGGGWVQIVMHNVCDACEENSVSLSTFTAFADWLQQQQAADVSVKTVREVIGGATKPAVAGPPPPAPTGGNMLRNPSLETPNLDGTTTQCFQRIAVGTSTGTWARTSDAHTGTSAERADIASIAPSGADRKLMSQQDLGTCAPTATAGHTYTVSGWYKSTANVRLAVYYRTAAGGWTSLVQSSARPASATWTQTSLTTAPLPAGATGISVGFSLRDAGSYTLDDLSVADTDQAAPTVALTAPGDGETVSGTAVPFTATASDAGIGGVDHVDFLVNGQVVGSDNSAPYQYSWDSTTQSAANVGVTARAVDTAGNSSLATPHLVTIANGPPPDITNPNVALTAPDDASTVSGNAVTLAADATDDTTVDHVDFLVDGNLVGTDSSAPYSLGWDSTQAADGSHTVSATAVDGAGNHATSATRNITVQNVNPDTTAPKSSILCDGGLCTSGWYGPGSVAVVLSSSDADAAAVRYTTDGSDPTASSTAYSAPITVSATTTVKYRAYDTTGNAEAVNSTVIQVDSADPVSSAACNGSGSCSGWFGSDVSVSLTADDGAGSGVASIHYTTNGDVPDGSSAAYTGPIQVSSSGTVKYRAYDNVGRAEQVREQAIQIDKAAPSTTAGCNGGACSGSWYTSAVALSLAAGDGSGSGVTAIRYTTDGTGPTATSPLYSGAVSLSATTTVKYRAFDLAGNVEDVQSATVKIDAAAPTASMSCNGGTCANWFNTSPVSVAMAGTDTGSGLAGIYYTSNGTSPTNSSTLFSSPISVPATTTFMYRSYDVANNSSAVGTQAVQIDLVKPTISITSPATGSVVKNAAHTPVNVSVADSGGSGLSKVSYFVDGKVVDTHIASPWTGDWNSKKTGTGSHTLYAEATDAAGNVQRSATITVTVK